MKKNKIIKVAIPILIIAVLAFLFSMNCSNTLWYKGNTRTDSSVFIYVARIILNGGMPYLDTFDHKGPLIYIINVLGILISKYRGIYVLEYINIFITFFFIYKIARLKCNEIISLIVLFVTSSLLFNFFEGGNFTEEYALPFITISIFIFLDYFFNKKINPFRLMVCGFSFGAVCLLRINMVSIWIAMCLMVLIKTIKERETKQLLNFILYFLLGFIIIVLPIMLWLISNNAFVDFINDYFIFNKEYTMGVSGFRMIAAREKTFMHFLNYPLIWISFIAVGYKYYKDRDEFDLGYIFYMFVTLIMLSMSGRIYGHYGMIIVPAIVYPFAYIFNELSKRKEKLALLIVASYFVITFSIPNYSNAIDKAFNDFSTRNKEHYDEDYVTVANLIKSKTNKDDKIIVSNYFDFIYLISNRFAASKYSFQVNGKWYDEFKNEVIANPPKIIVLNNIADNWMKEYAKGEEYTNIWTKKNISVYERVGK